MRASASRNLLVRHLRQRDSVLTIAWAVSRCSHLFLPSPQKMAVDPFQASETITMSTRQTKTFERTECFELLLLLFNIVIASFAVIPIA